VTAPDPRCRCRPAFLASSTVPVQHKRRCPLVAPPPPYVSRRRTIAEEEAAKMIDALAGNGIGGCICDDVTDSARTLIVNAIEAAMVRESEAT